MRTRFDVEHVIDAPPEVLHHCLADYRAHHRPGGFLPPAFLEQEVIRGGVGAGTELRFVVKAGGSRRTVMATITEPIPGRTIVETGEGIETTTTLEPTDDSVRVRFTTVMEEGGLAGIGNRLFAARLLRPIYEDELRRLEEVARSHPASLDADHPTV